MGEAPKTLDQSVMTLGHRCGGRVGVTRHQFDCFALVCKCFAVE